MTSAEPGRDLVTDERNTTIDSTVRFRRVTVVDGLGGPPRPDSWVLVEHGRITGIGPESAIDPNNSEPQIMDIDAAGHTVMPGLVNCHVHICNDGAPNLLRQVEDDNIPIATLRATRTMADALESGVTTVRDCGAADGIAIALSDAVTNGQLPGPRIVAAGRVITMTGGHGYMIGREVDGPDAVRHAVRSEMKNGAHFIKAMATGGVLTPGVETDHVGLTEDELLIVARTAHDSGRRTACHAIGGQGVKNALRAGIDSIEHGFHLDDEALQLAVNGGTYLVPTLVAIESITRSAGGGEMPDWVVRKAQRESGAHRAAFGAAVAAGVNIAAGTDSGTPYNSHRSLARELSLMVEYGMSAGAAVVAATLNAARNLNLEHLIGTVEVGKCADLIVVPGDPTQDIHRLEEVRLVMREGRVTVISSASRQT